MLSGLLGVAASNSKTLWYLTRGTGLTALVLLSLSVALGIVEVNRWSSPSWPRFVTAALHKNVSLLATVFLAVHITTAVLDAFAPIHWLNVFIPFTSSYRPLWLGLGAVATDLIIALIVTSLLRHRLGLRMWRAVHWSAYAAWPVAVFHGLGTGTDSQQKWALAVYAACLAGVAGCVWWRLATGWTPEGAHRRVLAAAGSVVVPALMVLFLVVGPLRPGWAVRAGTPKTLIASAHPGRGGAATTASPPASSASGSSTSGSSTSGSSTSGSAGFAPPFSARLAGSLSESTPDGEGQATVTIQASVSGGVSGVLHISLTGPADAGGGITMSSSTVSLGPTSDASLYRGVVTALDGDRLQLSLHDSAGHILAAIVRLRTQDSGAVSGSLSATS